MRFLFQIVARNPVLSQQPLRKAHIPSIGPSSPHHLAPSAPSRNTNFAPYFQVVKVWRLDTHIYVKRAFKKKTNRLEKFVICPPEMIYYEEEPGHQNTNALGPFPYSVRLARTFAYNATYTLYTDTTSANDVKQKSSNFRNSLSPSKYCSPQLFFPSLPLPHPETRFTAHFSPPLDHFATTYSPSRTPSEGWLKKIFI